MGLRVGEQWRDMRKGHCHGGWETGVETGAVGGRREASVVWDAQWLMYSLRCIMYDHVRRVLRTDEEEEAVVSRQMATSQQPCQGRDLVG